MTPPRPIPRIPAPSSFLDGVDEPEPVHCRNVILFERRTAESLQQREFANRSHHRHVLILVLKTGGTVLLDGNPLRMAEGESLLVLPFQFHHYADLAGRRLRWLFLSFECVGGGERLETLRFRVWKPSDAALEIFRETALLWCRMGLSSAPGELLGTVDRLLARALFEQRTDAATPTGVRRRTWTERAEAALRRTLDEGRTLEEAAQSLGMSARNLQIRFRRETGVSPGAYRANYRLHRALALLRETEFTLAAVAEQVGFASQPAFNRFIKDRTGTTPGAVRRGRPRSEA